MLMLLFTAVLLLSPRATSAQFPTICNTPENLETKTCCPNNCNGRGNCVNITELVVAQYEKDNQTVVEILRNAPNVMQKGTADARFMWPTVVFENVCVCEGNYWGADCSECNFRWTGSNCNTRRPLVVRKSFARLTSEEKQTFIDATAELKREVGVWSVVVEEPRNYTTGTVTLQDVSTYDFFVYLHDYVARDGRCRSINDGITIDFSHSASVFPVWHRRYMLTLEREFQRITGNESFGFPYWQWEQDDRSMFTEQYYGVPSNGNGPAENVTGDIINPEDWNTICDITYQINATCEQAWRLCNPANDLAQRNALQRGGMTTYLPNVIEVMIALAAPSYDVPDVDGQYFRNSPRTSFRSRLEGWNIICSAVKCTGPPQSPDAPFGDHMHNNVHDWVGGQMDDVPAAVNDPIFNLHHCNVDRILESWMQRFAGSETSQNLLPAYVPVSDGHPGHNRDDFMVPFFPLIRAGDQYRVSEEWGYVYDEIIPALIADSDIADCSEAAIQGECPICDANATCINCTDQTCPAPNTIPPVLDPERESNGPDPERARESNDDDSSAVALGLGVGLGIALLIAIIVIIVLIVVICITRKGSKGPSSGHGVEMTTKT